VVNKEEVIKALKGIRDPELGISIYELGMVKDVKVSNGLVKVKVALTVPNCPLRDTIRKDIVREVSKVKGVKGIDIRLTHMSKEELDELKKKIYEKRKMQKLAIRKMNKGGIRSIFAIISGKGGVGKSFVTSILAVELRKMGFEIGILDADVTGPSIPKIFGLNKRPRASKKGIIPVETKLGIKVISMNLLLDDPTMPVIWRGPLISSAIKQLYRDVDWGDLHFLLIDLPPGTSDAPLTVFQLLPIDGIVVVTTPQELALMIVAKAANMAKRLEVSVVGLIENMAYYICPHCNNKLYIYGRKKGEEAAKLMNAKFLGEIPIDSRISELADQGKIEEYECEEVNEVANKFRELVNEILEKSASSIPIAWRKERE
jgi:Mrp family chromosome partitioning ATPase